MSRGVSFCRRAMRLCFTRAGCLLLSTLLLPAAICAAHPLSQGALDVTVHPDHVTVAARVTVEEVAVANSSTGSNPLPAAWAASGLFAYQQHADYVAAHLHLSADGVPLPGVVKSVDPPNSGEPAPGEWAAYVVEYRPATPISSIHHLDLRTDMFADAHFAAGQAWDATYIVRIAADGRPADEGLLLSRTHPIAFSVYATDSTRSATFASYFCEGIHHILTGYDHLLFVSALVLATVTLWDLIKVVSAFTVAHTITLTLASLHWVHLSERIVEPLIAASIVFVALQNVLWPKRSRGWARLAAAFFFGLFHGLGFAGGFLEAAQQMQTPAMLLSIAAFSIGVETGHQMVVLPLFVALKLARHTQDTPAAREYLSLQVQRFGSAAISVAGLFFLAVALRGPGR